MNFLVEQASCLFIKQRIIENGAISQLKLTHKLIGKAFSRLSEDFRSLDSGFNPWRLLEVVQDVS